MVSAPDTDGGSGCLDLVVVFIHTTDGARDSAEAAFEQGDKATLRAICLAAVQESSDAQLGIWTHDDQAIVFHLDLR